MSTKKNNGLKIICLNRKASFNYFLSDLFEAGLVLRGSEIKSVRDGKVSIADSYGIEKDGEIYLINSHIPFINKPAIQIIIHMQKENYYLIKREINKLIGKMNKEGLTLVPTKMYFKKGKAKIEIAVAKGKKNFDKRQSKKTKDWNRDKARYFRKTS